MKTPMETLPVEWLRLNTLYTLTSAITAFRTSQEDHQDDSGGPICELPEDVEVEVYGGGFNKRTVKVRYGDCYYHVFWRDLASATVAAAQTAASAEPAGLLRLAEMLKDQDQTMTVEMLGQASSDRA
jgi:hypothetical protein